VEGEIDRQMATAGAGVVEVVAPEHDPDFSDPEGERAHFGDECENVTEVQIERDDDAAVGASSLDNLQVEAALESDISNVSDFFAKVSQERDGLRRDSRVCQKPHASRAEWVQFVLGECGCIGKCLADVLLVQVWQLLDDLRRRHPISHEIDDVCHRDAKSADSGSSGQQVGSLRNAIERPHRMYLLLDCTRRDAMEVRESSLTVGDVGIRARSLTAH
jgi:hypothetical protein